MVSSGVHLNQAFCTSANTFTKKFLIITLRHFYIFLKYPLLVVALNNLQLVFFFCMIIYFIRKHFVGKVPRLKFSNFWRKNVAICKTESNIEIRGRCI